MNNHLGDTNKMVGDTPRTDAHNWHDGDYDDPLHAFYDFACILERELNAANAEIEEKRKDIVYLATEKAKLEERIKRLEEAGDNLHFGWIDGYMNQRRLDEWLKAKEAKL